MMNQALLPLIIGAALILIVAGMIVWRVTRRAARPGIRRTLLRLVSMAAVIGLVGFGGLSIANSQLTGEASTESVIIPAETLVVSTGDLAVTLNAAGSLLPADEEILTFEASAPVTEILVQAGDMVAAGDVLARLDTTDIEARIASAEIALREAQAARDALTAPASDLDIEAAELSIQAAQASMSSAAEGPSEADIEIARLEAELAKNQLWQSQINRDVRLEPNPEFRGNNAYAQEITTNAGVEGNELSVQIAASQYEATLNEGPDSSALASANAQLESAQAELETLLNGPTEAELRKVDIDFEAAQLDLNLALAELEDAALIAPYDGLVAAENLTIGALPPADGAVTLIDLSQYTLDLSIDETDIADLALGQVVELDIQALDDVPVTGRITRLDIAPTTSGQLVTYTTEVTLDPTSAVLRPGMSAVATVILEQVEGIITVPNRFIQTDTATGQASVMVEVSPGTYRPVPVTLGLRTLDASEIVEGISAGQTIVILPSADADSSSAALRIPGLPGAGTGGGGGFAGPGAGGPPPGG